MRPLSWCFSLALLLVTSIAHAQRNEVYDRLTEKGVSNGSVTLKLPTPVMADGLTAEAQAKIIKDLTTTHKKPYEEFMRKAVVAPFILKITDEEGTMKRVDAYFVAYGSLDTLMREGFRKVDDGGGKDAPVEEALKADGTPLDEATLKKRGIKVKDDHETYVYTYTPIFEKLRIHSVIRSIDTRGKDSVLLAGVIDERFNKDEKYANFWQALKRDDAGKLIIDSTKHTYDAAGSYAKATQLVEPKGAIFVEYHIVFDEPQGWFNGARLLVSKLPIAAKTNIEKLRAQLKKEEESKDGVKSASPK